jgi:capsular polysaccharide biosynthesis protein
VKQKNLILLIVVGFFTAIIAYIFSTMVFKPPAHRSTKVPVAGSISTSFPDIKNDPTYNIIFNTNALDPAVPLQAGGNNIQPFNGK